MKKGRYSYEKRAETIIQSRTYWHSKFELEQQQQQQQQPPATMYEAPAAYTTVPADTPVSFVQQLQGPGTFIPHAQGVQHPETLVDEMTPVASYEEVPTSPQDLPSNIQTTPFSGMMNMKPGLQPIEIKSAGFNPEAHTATQPNVQIVPGQVSAQVASSPDAVSDDSGVFFLSPKSNSGGSAPVTPNTSSLAPPPVYTTTIIDEPQTQAKIVEVVPGKVRSVNMRRELVIDGQSISYLLEGVLVAPDSSPTAPAAATRRPSEDSNFSDDMTIDGQSIAAMLKDVMTEASGADSAASRDFPDIVSIAAMDTQPAVNQVLIDGKPVGEMFHMFSAFPGAAAAATETHGQQHLVPQAAVQPNVPTSIHIRTTATSAQEPMALESTSPTLTQIQETAQTLINMATMESTTRQSQSPVVSPSTSTSHNTAVSTTDSQGTSDQPPSTSAADEAFRAELMAGQTSDPDEALKQLLTDRRLDAEDMDQFIDRVFEIVQKNRIVPPDFVSKIPTLEKNFLVSHNDVF